MFDSMQFDWNERHGLMAPLAFTVKPNHVAGLVQGFWIAHRAGRPDRQIDGQTKGTIHQ